MSDLNAKMRALPSVAQVLTWPTTAQAVTTFGRNLVVESVQAALDAERHALRTNDAHAYSDAQLMTHIADWLHNQVAPTLRPVINAAGVIVHTNLGRAPLSRPALDAIDAIASGYSNLEYDLAPGQRGSRSVHAAQLVQRLTGAEAATVVNNAAAAVLLMLTALCQGREVIISRGQLVEIGGGFRIPDVMAQSGARLVEVGTTNRTHVRDYANAITDNTAAILVAHHSNFKIIGFTTEPSLAELAELARAHNLLLLYDQGSGALLDTSPYGLEREPLVGESVTAGCDVVAFSGDKLLGGPQAGILCGRKAPIAQLKRHPLARAVRPDKLCYAALSATLSSYVRGSALDEIPVWRMMSVDSAELHATATRWANALQTHHIDATVIDGFSTVGGGTLPGQQLPTTLVALTVPDAESVAYRLRTAETAVICRIQRDQLLFDPRTVLPHQTNTLLKTIVEIVKPHE